MGGEGGRVGGRVGGGGGGGGGRSRHWKRRVILSRAIRSCRCTAADT